MTSVFFDIWHMSICSVSGSAPAARIATMLRMPMLSHARISSAAMRHPKEASLVASTASSHRLKHRSQRGACMPIHNCMCSTYTSTHRCEKYLQVFKSATGLLSKNISAIRAMCAEKCTQMQQVGQRGRLQGKVHGQNTQSLWSCCPHRNTSHLAAKHISAEIRHFVASSVSSIRQLTASPSVQFRRAQPRSQKAESGVMNTSPNMCNSYKR